jgi:hypothetical protein
MDQAEIGTALVYLKAQFLKPGETFDIRKQANAIVARCFRNTKLEDFHAEGYISDNEMKNLSIDACARIEYLLSSERFSDMLPSEIFSLAFETPYKTHVKRDLRKPMWKALRKQSESLLHSVQSLKSKNLSSYEVTLLRTWSTYALYYNEDIKFDGQHLSGDPHNVVVGHQFARHAE